MRFYHDLNVLIERYEKAEQPLDGKLPELAAQHLGDVRLADAQQIGRLDLLKRRSFISVSIL